LSHTQPPCCLAAGKKTCQPRATPSAALQQIVQLKNRVEIRKRRETELERMLVAGELGD
jgi:hypothetical protein